MRLNFRDGDLWFFGAAMSIYGLATTHQAALAASPRTAFLDTRRLLVT